jgi:hypothetical protein
MIADADEKAAEHFLEYFAASIPQSQHACGLCEKQLLTA